MIKAAVLEREKRKKPFCTLPFDHTLEAENMGGNIRYGNEKAGPRAAAPVCSSLEELSFLSRMDPESGRMAETLAACRMLREQGEEVVFQMSGPYTIWNTLIELKQVFKAARKTPEQVEALFQKLEEDLLGLLLEVKKNELYELPDILDELSGNPLKFIIFIDDLSFSSNDDNFAALKAILEGGVASCGKNVLIYATSNRRHLVKETMTERQGDELYLNDTLQETMSLAARFGLTITFQKPGKDDYLSIVKHLAKQYGVSMDEEELCIKAEAFAIRCNGRSPRTAKHFIELQKAGI